MSRVLEQVFDADDATVGGGSAAGLAGAMSAGLAGMVSRLSSGRDCGLDDSRYMEIAAECQSLCRQLHEGAHRDAEAYALVAAAYRPPQEESEAANGVAVIDDALVAAATAPLHNAKLALDVLALCAELVGRSHPSAATDLYVSALLADVAVRGALVNVSVNTGAISDRAIASKLDEQVAALRAEHRRFSAPQDPT